MGKKTRKRKEEGQQEAPPRDSAQSESQVEIQARNVRYNHVYSIVLRDGGYVCPHCIRQVPKGNVIDPDRQARLEKREKELADREQSHFAQMVSMYNTNLRQLGKPELSPEQVEAAREHLTKLFEVGGGVNEER